MSDKNNLNIKEYLTNSIRKALKKIPNISEEDSSINIILESPANSDHGDIACNTAFLLAKKLKTNPRQISVELMKNFDWDESYVIPDTELKETIKGPGFINFRYSNQYLYSELRKVLNKKDSKPTTPKRILLEFVSANPTGPMVIVNARAAAIGDAMARMYKYCGWDVNTEYYVNDAGNQVKLLGESVEARYMEILKKDWDFPENGYHGKYVYVIAENILKEYGEAPLEWPSDKRKNEFGKFALELNIAEQKKILKKYGTEFDNWQSEKELYNMNLLDEVQKIYNSKELIYEKEGAKWLKTSQFGDDKDRVFVTSKKTNTYIYGDSAYHLHKAKRNYDKYITLWGPDHHGYIPSLEASIRALGYDSSKFVNLIIQQVSLLSGGKVVKMSKRSGEFITLNDLMEDIGVDAARYFFLMRKLNTPFNFDLDLAKKKSDDNPVFYIQYAHARIAGVIRHAQTKNIKIDKDADLSLLTAPEEKTLIKKIIDFPNMIIDATEACEPHRIPLYLQGLASNFHSFYHNNRVVSDDIKLSHARVFLSFVTKNVIKSALDLLGVTAPEKM